MKEFDAVNEANMIVEDVLDREDQEWIDPPDTAEILIEQIFEVWSAFDQEARDNECPGCNGNMEKLDHEKWCWFGRAKKWLDGQKSKSNSVRT